MDTMQGIDELDLSVTPWCGCGKCWVAMIRLSSNKETSDSPEKQAEHAREQAAASGGHIIGWAVDLDVSGATDPFKRKGFGPWLKGKKGPFDGVVASAVDRIGRSLRDVLNTAHFLINSGKVIITHGHGVWNFADPNERTMFNFQALAADIELGQVQQRSAKTKERQRKTGQKVGRLAHGYRYVRTAESRVVHHIGIDQDVLTVLEESAARLLADTTGLVTLSSEARRLTAAGVLAPSDYRRVLRGLEPKGLVWNPTTLRIILTSPATQGYYMQDNQPVNGPDGEPITIAPPMWSYAKHKALVEKLAPKPLSRKRAPKADYMGVEISTCGECGNRLYYQKRQQSENRTYHDSYQCKARQKGLPGGEACKPSPTMHAGEFQAAISERFLSEFGSLPLFEQAFDPGSDATAKLAEARDKRKRLKTDREAGLYDEPDEYTWFQDRYKALTQEIKTLEGQPRRAPRSYWRPTGRLVADEWNAAQTDAGHRELMASYGFHVELYRSTAEERLKFAIMDPEVLHDARAASWEAMQRDLQMEADYFTLLEMERAAVEADTEQGTEDYLIPSEDEQAAGLCSLRDGAEVLNLVS